MAKVTTVNIPGKKVFLVGTAHVSDESVNLVRETIERETPDAVAVELCKQRHQSLMNEKKWDETEINEVIKSGKTYLFLIQLLLANFQRRIGDKVHVKPGAEMKKAVDIARKKRIKVELVDRDVKTTLKRAFSRMSLVEKAKLLYDFTVGVLEGEEVDKELIEKLKKKDVLSEMLDELGKEIPSVKKVLVDERDEYIALRLREIKEDRIVAVVGAGHVEGIKRNLKKNAGNTKKRLERLGKFVEKKSLAKYLPWIVPLAFIAVMLAGFLTHDVSFTWNMILKWFLVQGTLSALGATLALAHPVTIVATFIAAPFAVLHPFIAVGWISALVELKMRKPKVRDFKGLMKLNGVGDYWKNRVTRIFLILMLANLGGTISTLVVLPYLALHI
ncbi:MAG: TraB/GumN family protein [Candidatus Altiarchaeales archaeon]|nr:TraB/GumN family protein [Candidatus Altiarchaeales archaeon]